MVASRRSGLMRTSGTVIRCPSSTGSCTSPWASASASAWRTASPTRSWRCDGPTLDSRCCSGDMKTSSCDRDARNGAAFARAGGSSIGFVTNFREASGGRPREYRTLQRALHRLHPVAFDDVALAHVLEVLERHAAFLAGEDFPGVVLEALELRQLAFVDHHVVADQPHVRAAFDGAVGDV